ncbi:MAG: hypothetical protein ABFD46_10780 [Armatimonadota bacterium]
MDVRAADTSNLAAKRLELDSVRPVTHKTEGIVDQQQAVRLAGGVGDDDSDSEPEPEMEFEEDSESESVDKDNEQVIDCRDGENDGGTDGKHILDVRV